MIAPTYLDHRTDGPFHDLRLSKSVGAMTVDASTGEGRESTAVPAQCSSLATTCAYAPWIEVAGNRCIYTHCTHGLRQAKIVKRTVSPVVKIGGCNHLLFSTG